MNIDIKQTLPPEKQAAVNQITSYLERLLSTYSTASNDMKLNMSEKYTDRINQLLQQLLEIYKTSAKYSFDIQGSTFFLDQDLMFFINILIEKQDARIIA